MGAARKSMAELLEEHPWPTRARGDLEPLEVVWQFELGAEPQALWTWLTDTSRLNRALGLSPMRFFEEDGVLVGEGTTAGVAHRWVERPWSWVEGTFMVGERIYDRGLARRAKVIYRLDPQPEGLRVEAYLGWLPRHRFGRWVLRFGLGWLEPRLRRLLTQLALHRAEGPPPDYLALASGVTDEAERRLAAARRRLDRRGLDEAVVDAFFDYLRRGDDVDVARLKPRAVARRLQIPERELLLICLHATRAGVLDLSWDVVCPHCRGVREELSHLGDVPAKSSCEPCAVEFGTEGPSAIEVTFRVHPSIREVTRQEFCSAQTAQQRHIVVQQVVAPSSRRVVEADLAAGRYRLRRHGQDGVAYLDVADSGDGGSVSWSAAAPPADTRVGGTCRFELDNDGDDEAIFIVEQLAWADDVLRPAELLSLQAFRDLFSEEFIAAGIHLAVGEQTILFTDIVGSTRLYLERGDPEAFAAVRQHFTRVFRTVVAHEGAVVKTIGDAAMATFNDASRAVSAALALHQAFPPGETIRLRISIHTGLCIAVNLNSNIDYFGNTVNLAAKLQGIAGAGDVALSEATRRAAGVEELLQAKGAELERVELDLPIVSYRWATTGGA